MIFKKIIWVFGIVLMLYGFVNGIAYMFENPKFSHLYLADVKYWESTILVPIGILLTVIA